jgi:hypothetical protein
MQIERTYVASPKQKEDFDYNNLVDINDYPMIMRLDITVPVIDNSCVTILYRRLVENHELLRSIFHYYKGALLQKVIKYDPNFFVVENVELNEFSNSIHLNKLSLKSLEEKVPIRVLLLEDSSPLSNIVILLHHIVSDKSTILIIEKELKENFLRYSKGRPLLNNEYPQFGEFWESKRQENYGWNIANIRYWKNCLMQSDWLTDFTSFSSVPKERWEIISDNNINYNSNGYTITRVMLVNDFEKLQKLKKTYNISCFIIILTLFRAFYFYKTKKSVCVIQSHYEDYSTRRGIIGNFLKKILHFSKFADKASLEDQLFHELESYAHGIKRPLLSSESFREHRLSSRSFLFINYLKKESSKVIPDLAKQPVATSKIESPIVCLIHSYPQNIFFEFSFNSNYFGENDSVLFVDEFNLFISNYLQDIIV